MLVVTASAAFTATAGFCGSFTESEIGKCVSSIPNQGLFLFIYPEEEEREKEKGEETGKICHLCFFSKMIVFPQVKDQ